MSYSTIYSIKFSKQCEEIAELRNGHGSAPVIWDALGQKYLGLRPFAFTDERIWKLYEDKSIPAHHRAVLIMTFDHAYLKKANFKRAAQDIRKFLADFPRDPQYVNHWPKIAEILESSDVEDVQNIGIQHTSVSENQFMDGSKARKKKDCYEVYETLEEKS
jgi:hypothetical protein